MTRGRPTFTLVTALYRSARFLPAYLDSVDALEGGLDDVEIVFVDDGSPDDSSALVEAWIEATGAPGRVIDKEHGGSASAANRGLDDATGTWVSFPDPDDALDVGYLAAVRRFLADLDRDDVAPSVSVVATKVVQFTDDPAHAVDNHVLGYRYHQGPRSVHLDLEPRWFHTHAPSGFYRRELIEKTGLRLDPRLFAAFEDAAFEAELLLGIDDPVVGFVPDAVYVYRRRPDSVIGTMWSKPERYTTVVELGYLHLLRLRADPPAWLQNLVLYDLIWYFYEYDRPDTPNRSVDEAVAVEFLVLLDRVLSAIDARLIIGYSLHPLSLRIRSALVSRKLRRLPVAEARVVEQDADAGRIRVRYLAPAGSTPETDEVVTVDGIVRSPIEATTHPIEYYGETFLVERELLLDATGTVMIELDQSVLPLVEDETDSAAWFPWDRRPPPSQPDDRVPPPRGVSRRVRSLVTRARRMPSVVTRRFRPPAAGR